MSCGPQLNFCICMYIIYIDNTHISEVNWYVRGVLDFYFFLSLYFFLEGKVLELNDGPS